MQVELKKGRIVNILELVLDLCIKYELPVRLDYREGGEREVIEGILFNDRGVYRMKEYGWAHFSLKDVDHFEGHFPNEKKIPLTVVVKRWM